MASRAYLLPVVAIVGFAAGRLVPRAEPGGEPVGSASSVASAPQTSASHSASFTPPELPVSTETIESLLRYNNNELHAPLALWLLDASAAQIGEFWSSYLKRGQPKDSIRDLIFAEWARRDPRAMLAAAKRDGEEVAAWWAWAKVDPDVALAAAEGQPDEIRNTVIRGIVAGDPRRGLEMLEKDPKLAELVDVWALADFAEKKDPRGGIDFLLSLGGGYALDSSFKHFAGKDPHAAFAWLAERSENVWLLKLFVERVQLDDPAILKEIAAGQAAGSMKRSLEGAIFAQLAASDPAKAMDEARATGSPRVAAERFALLGSQLLKGNKPEEALELLGELLAKCPDAPIRSQPFLLPEKEGSSSHGSVTGVPELLRGLAEWNPRATMDAMLEAGAATSIGDVGREWFKTQPAEFTAWWEQQQDPEVADFGASLLSQSLRTEKDYAGAVAMATRITDEKSRFFSLGQSFHEWVKADRAAALQWHAESAAKYDERLRHQFQKSLSLPER